MPKPSLADIPQQFLHLWNFHHARSPERHQRIVGESPLAYIATHAADRVLGRKSRETHRARLDQADARTVGIILAHGARDYFLIIHLDRPEEVLRQIRTVKTHGLVRIGAIIVVPI